MLIKFVNNTYSYDKSGQSMTDYTLRTHDSFNKKRQQVKVLRGLPSITGAFIDSLKMKNKMTHAVIAFHPNDCPTDEEINSLLDSFERLAFAGVGHNRFNYSAVLHKKNNTPHIHLIIPKADVHTGYSFNPCPPGRYKTYNELAELFNSLHGWTSPNDEKNRNVTKQADNWEDKTLNPIQQTRIEKKEEVNRLVIEQVESGNISSYNDLIEYLKTLGTITRQSDNYISLKLENSKKAIRLKGAVYEPKTYENAKLATTNTTELVNKPSEKEARAIKTQAYNNKVSKIAEQNKSYYMACCDKLNLEYNSLYPLTSQSDLSVQGVSKTNISKSEIRDFMTQVKQNQEYILRKLGVYMSNIKDTTTKLFTAYLDTFSEKNFKMAYKNSHDIKGFEPYKLSRKSYNQLLDKENIRNMKYMNNKNKMCIFVAPEQENSKYSHINLDDVSIESYLRLKSDFKDEISCIVETSPKNYQVWLKIDKIQPNDVIQVVDIQRYFISQYQTDKGATGGNRMGRACGFVNNKECHQRDDGTYPFSQLVECSGHFANKDKIIHLATQHKITLAEELKVKQAKYVPSDYVKNNQSYNNKLSADEFYYTYIKPKVYSSVIGTSEGDYFIAMQLVKNGYSRDDLYRILLAESPDLETRKFKHLEHYIDFTYNKCLSNLSQQSSNFRMK